MSPWLITTTALWWVVGAAIRDWAGAVGRPVELGAALITAGAVLLVLIRRRRSGQRSTS